MSALTVDLMGSTPMDEATIQARAQDIIAANWPQWKRERALRLGDVTALNAYMDEIAAEVDLARSNSALLADALAVEAATARLALPVSESMVSVELEDGTLVYPEQLRDVAERLAAQEIIDGASEQVLALVASRVPVPVPVPVPEPVPEPAAEVMEGRT
jgi:hypothetical protein